jgi:CPA2 family monovalent cation:H+ antiporter-2
MEQEVLGSTLVLLALSVAAVSLLRRIQLPAILGYLLVGVIAGPHAFGWLGHGEAIHLLAEIGVVFLLFMIGLEISIPHLQTMKGTVLGLGGSQVLLTTLVAGGIAWYAGVSWQGAVVIGGAFSLSSTAIAARQLTEQLEMQSRHGRVALGILLFQDLAVVPFLVLIPIFADGSESMLAPMLWALGKGILAFAIMFALGHWVLRPLFHQVATTRSIELFTLTILLVSLTAAWITNRLGLSLALGAFLAGIMLGESEYRHQIETEVRPFRDVLMGLFFISIGAQLDLTVLPDIWPWVLLTGGGLVIGKGLLITAITRLGGHEMGVAVRSGAVLAQGGEFGFALLALALANNLLSLEQSQPVLAAIILSMALAPILIRHNGRFAKRICTTYLRNMETTAQSLESGARELRDHVIICGFGRIGQNLASFLREEGFDYVALDLDPMLIREAWEAGERVYYGDSTHREILKKAGIQRARALAVTFDGLPTQQRIIHAARSLSDDLMIVVRTHDDHHLEELQAAGANDVVPESIEASMMLAAHLLVHLDVPRDEVERLVEKARADRYRRLRGFFHGEELEEVVEEEDRFRLHTVVLTEDCRAVGRSLADLKLERHGITVTGLRRHGVMGEIPSADLILEAGDALVLQGSAEALEYGEQRLLRG